MSEHGQTENSFQIVQDVSEEYDKVCHALTVLLESLPRVDIYADTFSQSYIVQQGVNDLFVNVLHFWVKACKFYRRRAIWNFMRSTWNDYNSEFQKLEASMTRAADRIEKGALAEHIKDSKTFMSEQRQRNDVQDSKSEDQSKLNRVFAPLLPPNENMYYYIRDHETARKTRHPSTCEWILRHPKFQKWSRIPAEKGGQLWINAGPGFGKTVLTSFIIDHFLDSGNRYERPILLYFYFRESSLPNNNATAAICSIAYQLHGQHESSRGGIEMNANAIYDSARDERKAGFEEVWRLLSMFLRRQTNLVLILDALDECEDNSLFLPRLLDLAIREKITLLLTSRRQKRLVRYLEHVETLEIAPGDVHHDIEAFVEFKVRRNVRLSHPLVRNIVMKKLLDQHDGMFLWITLMLKELKACISLEEVQMTLAQIPSGLEGIYTKIVKRLEKSLTRRAAEVARNILTWVLGSARALTMDELREALSCQYQAQGHTLLSDGEFPYTDKDIESMCGSLISIWHGQIQTVHQSTKEYLVRLGEDRALSQDLSILPTSVDTSLQLTSVCLTYQEQLCKSSLVKIQMFPFDHHPKGFDIRMLQANKKLLEYSFFYWIYHVVGCPMDHRESLAAIILKHFSNFMTVSWIVVSMSLDPRGLWRLLIGVEEVEEWLQKDISEENMSDAARHLQYWCSGTTKLLKAYGTVLLANPWTIWRVDLKAFLGSEQGFAASNNYFDQSKESEESLQSSKGQANQLQKTPRNPTLGHNQWSLLKARLGFFVHDRNQNIFLSGEHRTSEEGECLFVQHAETGKRLSPATAGLTTVLSDDELHYGHVITAKISAHGKYFAVAYHEWLSIWAIEPDLKFTHRLRDRGWAFRLISEKYQQERPHYMNAGMIEFAGDDKLFAPGGWYDLSTKAFHAFPVVNSSTTTQVAESWDICYSGDCSYLFCEQSEPSKKFSRQAVGLTGLADPVTTTIELDTLGNIKASNTGKYLLLYRKDASRMRLLNVALMEMKSFPRLQSLSHFGDCSFHFTDGDETLLTFLWEPETRRGVHALLTVTVWDLGSGQPQLCSQGQINTVVAANPATINNLPIISLTARDLAWILSCDRTVQVVKFSTEEISFPGYDPLVKESKALYSRVSQDGRRLGIIRIAGSKVHLEIIELLPSLQEALKLEGIIPNIQRGRPICLSPKLDLLVLGRFVLVIDTKANELPPPIVCDIDLITPERDWDWACTISNCGDFVTFDKPAYKHWLDCHDRQPGHSVNFRIDRKERTATRLTNTCPIRVQAASFDFHPSLPLAAFSSSEGEGSDNNQRSSRDPCVPANEINLSMIILNKDETTPLEPVQLTDSVCSKLYFADTGDFLLLEGPYHKSRIVVSDLPYQSQPLRVIPENRCIHPTKDRSYLLECRYTSIGITMYKFQSLTKGASLPAYQALESTAKVERLTVFPSTVGWSKAWLLLSEDYSEPLKVVLHPTNGEPLMKKTLMVSWNELRERLETTLTPVEEADSASEIW